MVDPRVRRFALARAAGRIRVCGGKLLAHAAGEVRIRDET